MGTAANAARLQQWVRVSKAGSEGNCVRRGRITSLTMATANPAWFVALWPAFCIPFSMSACTYIYLFPSIFFNDDFSNEE